MKAIVLALFIFTTPAQAWTIRWNDDMDNCSTEAEYYTEDPTEEQLEATREFYETIVILMDLLWPDEDSIQPAD